MAEALRRAEAYERAGADAILIHSKLNRPDEVFSFRELYQGKLPVVVVPTTYSEVTTTQLQERGFGAVIYANQALRGAISAMREVLHEIAAAGTTSGIEGSIASLKEVFALQNMDELLQAQHRHEQLCAEYARLAQD
jgi:phosphoenolpyruvate phosphomutase